MKKTTHGVIGILLSAVMIIIGIFLPVPDKEISWFGSASNGGYKEYVGGDAYNIQIEASLRGGIIAGRTAAKAIFISVGILQLFFSLGAFVSDSEQHNYHSNTFSTVEISKPAQAVVHTEQPAIHNTSDSWKCPKCGKFNPITQRICKDCGYEK